MITLITIGDWLRTYSDMQKSIFIFYEKKKRCRITICVYKEERSFNELPTHAACSVIYVKSIYSSVLVNESERASRERKIPIQIFIV